MNRSEDTSVNGTQHTILQHKNIKGNIMVSHGFLFKTKTSTFLQHGKNKYNSEELKFLSYSREESCLFWKYGNEARGPHSLPGGVTGQHPLWGQRAKAPWSWKHFMTFDLQTLSVVKALLIAFFFPCSYSAILCSWADSLRSHVILHEWPVFIACFWIFTKVVYL